MDNPLPLGVGALVVGLLQWRRIQEREARKLEAGQRSGEVTEADPRQVTCCLSDTCQDSGAGSMMWTSPCS